jgi:hypothetical protein
MAVLLDAHASLEHTVAIRMCTYYDFIIIPGALIYHILTDYTGYNIEHVI